MLTALRGKGGGGPCGQTVVPPGKTSYPITIPVAVHGLVLILIPVPIAAHGLVAIPIAIPIPVIGLVLILITIPIPLGTVDRRAHGLPEIREPSLPRCRFARMGCRPSRFGNLNADLASRTVLSGAPHARPTPSRSTPRSVATPAVGSCATGRAAGSVAPASCTTAVAATTAVGPPGGLCATRSAAIVAAATVTTPVASTPATPFRVGEVGIG